MLSKRSSAARPREPRDRDAIAEHVVHPAQSTGSGVIDEPRFDQPLVIAVARAQHHAVLAERHRLLVAVGRDVADGEKLHLPARIALVAVQFQACVWICKRRRKAATDRRLPGAFRPADGRKTPRRADR